MIVGNGFFKPNVTSILGTLYPPGSPRRDGGYTIYYIGVNLGGAIAPLVCGYIGEKIWLALRIWLGNEWACWSGLAVFVVPLRITQILILLAALFDCDCDVVHAGQRLSIAGEHFSGVAWSMRPALWHLSHSAAADCPRRWRSRPTQRGWLADWGQSDLSIWLTAGILLVPIFALLLPQTPLSLHSAFVRKVLSVGYLLVRGISPLEG